MRPIVESGGIEVRSIGPYQSVDLRIDLDLTEQLGVLERTEDLAFQHGPKIDDLNGIVLEPYPQGVEGHGFKG